MGLEVREHLQLGAVVTHSGGLPGFGSNMRWLPDRGVGVVALANATYVPAGAFTRDALELLHERGALSPSSRGRPLRSSTLRPSWPRSYRSGTMRTPPDCSRTTSPSTIRSIDGRPRPRGSASATERSPWSR